MAYQVIEGFIDAKTGKGYRTGDTYDGQRAKELSSNANQQGRPLIKEVKTTKAKQGE